MTSFWFGWILIVIINVIIIDVISDNNINDNTEYCLANDTNPYLLFSTKTAYQYIHGSYFVSKDEEKDRKKFEGSKFRANLNDPKSECEPLQYWSVIRHGTRLPSEKNIIAFQKILPQLQKRIIENYETKHTNPKMGSLCVKDYENLKKWSFDKNILPEHENYLTEQGKKDLKYLARRTGNFLATLFYPSGDFNPDNYIFKYTETERVLKSYESFIEGAFDSDAKKIHGIIIAENDTIIENYKTCDAYLKNEEFVRKNSQSEPNRFLQTNVFRQLIRNVTIKLGFTDQDLNPFYIQLMYNICRYEKAWYFNRNPASPWCAIFTPRQLEVLEYWQDLDDYYIDGYGNRLSTHLGCFAAQDLIYQFERVIQAKQNGRQDYPKVVTSFGHSAIVNMLFTTLGIAKDSFSIRSDNFNTNKTNNRLWRTSKLTPFAANLAAVLYECEGTNNTIDYKMEFYLNEILLRNYGSNNGVWKWTDFYDKFKSIISKCSLDVCKTPSDIKVEQV